MAKKGKILKNKKILWITAGMFLTSGILTGILVPLLSKKDDKKQEVQLPLIQKVINANSNNSAIIAMQKFYGLKLKNQSAINGLPAGILKTKYQSANSLGTLLFANKKTHHILFVNGQEKTTKLNEVLLIVTPKNKNRKTPTTGKWPLNHLDQKNDEFAFLITFFKKQVIKVTQLVAKKTITNAASIFFKIKQYDLLQIFYQFKNANLQATDFNYYNAYLDDENSTDGLALFKDYLLSLKAEDSAVTSDDLTGLQFTKISGDFKTRQATALLIFTYQGLSAKQTITDFHYQKNYSLSFKPGTENKMADEVVIKDILTNNLPEEVTITEVQPSLKTADGSTITVTLNDQGKIIKQELAGLTSYQAKAQAILQSSTNNDFPIINKANVVPSAYNSESNVLNQLMTQAEFIENADAKRKVQEIMSKALVTFAPNDEIGVLKFIITIDETIKEFTFDGLDADNVIRRINARIDAEAAKKTKPTIKPGSEWKTIHQVTRNDIIFVTPSDSTLILKIKPQESLTKDYICDILKTSKLCKITIEISSPVKGTKTVEYEVDLEGFINDQVNQDFEPLVGPSFEIRLNRLINNRDFINLQTDILASQFKDKQLIRNVFKQKATLLTSHLGETRLKNLQNAIDNNMEITFIKHNDEQGEVEFRIRFSSQIKSFKITGFRTSS